MPYDLAEIRKKLHAQTSGKVVDPDEFKPDKASSTTEPLKYRYFVLPPIMQGDALKSGTVAKSMTNFYIPHGDHWINNKPNPCPRIADGSDCAICQIGFDLLREEKDEEKRKQIVKQWMPNSYFLVNIYFLANQSNPEELRGKVRFFRAPKTCFDIWAAAIDKDGPGDDPTEPHAYGVFFDENAAFAFQLEVVKQGKNNSYKTSKFIANGGVPIPMIRNQDGSANKEGIAKLLKCRHNLFTKVQDADPAKIAVLAKALIDGEDPSAVSAGFDKDEVAPQTTTTAAPPKTTTKAASKPQAAAPAVSDDLAEEAPFSDDLIEPTTNAAAVAEPATAPAAVAGNKDDIETDEIKALLSQLDDD